MAKRQRKQTPNTRSTDPFQLIPKWVCHDPKNQPRVQVLIPDVLYIIDQALSTDLCTSLISAAEAYGFVTADHVPKKGMAYRNAGRIALPNHVHLTRNLESLVIPIIADVVKHPESGAKPVSLNDNIRFYKYGKGQSFGKHYDESVDVPNGRTEFTLLAYLSGDGDSVVGGGETIFYHPDSNSKVVASVQPVRGRILIHRHGHRCYLHEGAIVTKGTKYVLRSDIVYPSP